MSKKCHYCGKVVRDRRFLGTIHLCRSPEEREQIDMMIRGQLEELNKRPVAE